ncbi:hypothetical protein [Thermomonospora cellulosilytica]|uniref:Uncharacterized protein n=1 Tax=Thermomonospora cellulosilytica TaxID=1411118 RepID=A0A7W3R6W3_9ACTN|nr:hypothetical protein [Thermomonospora cellulosilytica]MBA9001740.1 hypothetical protein [Thermomonospora cellulosilytica]
MSTTLAPPVWPIPVPTPDEERSKEERRQRQLAALHARFPDALAWYGPKSGLWLAAPSGAVVLIQATSAADLAAQLAAYYKALAQASRRRAVTASSAAPQTPRPAFAQPTQRRTPGGAADGAVVRSTPPQQASCTTAPTSPPRRPTQAGPRHAGPRHVAEPTPGRFRRFMSGLGLVAAA